MSETEHQLAERPTEREDEDYSLDPRTVEAILDAVDAGDAAAIDRLMEPLHAADIADLFEQIGTGARAGASGAVVTRTSTARSCRNLTNPSVRK